MNFYYRELSHQNLETDRLGCTDHKNIDILTNRQLMATLRLIEISLKLHQRQLNSRVPSSRKETTPSDYSQSRSANQSLCLSGRHHVQGFTENLWFCDKSRRRFEITQILKYFCKNQ